MQSAVPQRSQTFDQAFVDTIIAERTGRPGALLGILQKVQEHQPAQYLPTAVLEYIAAKTAIPLSRIYGVVTFYALFSLEPQGRNSVCICRGTACHTRGSRDLLETAMMSLGLAQGQDGEMEALSVTTADGRTTLRTVACFGQCALAPVVEVNHTIFGHMNERSLLKELGALDQGDLLP
ncbi:MAG: NAD(P)H-dependent oxidoreductase subunit E [Ancalomicrobiaceae bacterium]|nr:NAD(P)H-dependent oxidoreductase subunit E [Ancalomicrobiaceae bacterium]